MSVSKVQVFDQMQLKSAIKNVFDLILDALAKPTVTVFGSSRELLPQNIAAIKDNSWHSACHLFTPVVVVFNATNSFKYSPLNQPRSHIDSQ